MFEFYMPRETLSIAAMKMLRRPTPLLERVWLQEMQDGDIISGLAVLDIISVRGICYFPICHILRKFGWIGTNVVVILVVPIKG